MIGRSGKVSLREKHLRGDPNDKKNLVMEKPEVFQAEKTANVRALRGRSKLNA